MRKKRSSGPQGDLHGGEFEGLVQRPVIRDTGPAFSGHTPRPNAYRLLKAPRSGTLHPCREAALPKDAQLGDALQHNPLHSHVCYMAPNPLHSPPGPCCMCYMCYMGRQPAEPPLPPAHAICAICAIWYRSLYTIHSNMHQICIVVYFTKPSLRSSFMSGRLLHGVKELLVDHDELALVRPAVPAAVKARLETCPHNLRDPQRLARCHLPAPSGG